MVENSAYNRFAPFIREYIYREKWKTLRNFQEKAALEILDGKDNVIIAASTASGKTEAAFFPVLSVMDTVFRAGEKPVVVYISPLKALINDQAKRLTRLLTEGRDSEETIMPICRWHGDVGSGSKNRFVSDPSGILLITPESLEALLLHRTPELGRIFRALLFVVIDEVHVFMGSDRGSQLICQLARIEKARTAYNASRGNNQAAPQNIFSLRRIGLSATLGDYKGGQNWLSQGTNLGTTLVEDNSAEGKELSLSLDYHVFLKAHKKEPAFYDALYAQCKNKRVIIFTNSRLQAEECAASLNTLAKKRNEKEIFQIHHGSVSAMLRDEAEELLKTGEGPQVICATSTLELGIDIGDLDRIIQLGPPWSVSAFVQRIGRSGRQSGRAEMYFGITGNRENAGKDPVHEIPFLPWELFRTIAVIQLYLEEKWIEPPKEKALPYSLLVHQLLAVLASLGEHTREALAHTMLSFPPFAQIPVEDFRALTAWLTDCGLIGITEEGTLILGLEGERIVNRHSFYPVFPGDETFRVVCEGREIGTINFIPSPLSVLTVGGTRWIVKHIDGQKREIWVAETQDEGSERLWRGGRGGGTHYRIAGKIRHIIAGTQDIPTAFPYLSASACKALETGREAAQKSGITASRLIQGETEELVFLFPWTGTAGMRTIAAVLGTTEHKKQLGIVFVEEKEELYFRITTKLPFLKFQSLFADICQNVFTAGNLPELVKTKEIPFTDKYDYVLPPQLLAKQYAANMLDKTALGALIRQ